jgi:hypothetical protein
MPRAVRIHFPTRCGDYMARFAIMARPIEQYASNYHKPRDSAEQALFQGEGADEYPSVNN